MPAHRAPYPCRCETPLPTERAWPEVRSNFSPTGRVQSKITAETGNCCYERIWSVSNLSWSPCICASRASLSPALSTFELSSSQHCAETLELEILRAYRERVKRQYCRVVLSRLSWAHGPQSQLRQFSCIVVAPYYYPLLDCGTCAIVT